MRAAHNPPSRKAFLVMLLALVAACANTDPGAEPGDNVQVQVGNFKFYQDYWRAITPPTARLTGPFDDETFAFTFTDDLNQPPDQTKNLWHKYKFSLQNGQQVTLRVREGLAATAPLIFERTCTVHPRALQLEYAEFRAYGSPSEIDEDGTPLPPGPDAQCGCGFVEYGDQRNANQCFP
jgi:hypothetical protein